MNIRTVDILSRFTLHDYQQAAVEDAIDLIGSNPDQWHLFSSPTGTGKSIIELALLQCLPGGLFITPRVEIIQGMLEKLGHYVDDVSQSVVIELAAQYGIYTPIRLRNLLAKGDLKQYPRYLMVDECHHDLSDSYQDITMYLNGIPKLGLTATPYRGTPDGTRKFYEQWGNCVTPIITLTDAINRGFCSLPSASVLPLVDDDTISVVSGEFKVASSDALIFDRIKALVLEVIARRYWCPKSKLWDRPTMFSVPSTATANQLAKELNAYGIKAETVTQSTSNRDRKDIFRDTVNLKCALVQIDVVSEGVDLPIRRLIDIRPTMSPIKWVQQIGRIMRPISKCARCKSNSSREPFFGSCECEQPPEYICCCRNLERHAYLMEGMFPNSTVKEAQEAFGVDEKTGLPKFSVRSGSRVTGLEGFGKFICTPVPLMDGTTVFTYNLVHTSDFQRTEYFAIVHPNSPEVVVGEKVSARNPQTNELQWGKWRLIESIPDLKGCRSQKEQPLSPNQSSYWNGAAEGKGLNIHFPVTARSFQILPFLRNTGLSFKR